MARSKEQQQLLQNVITKMALRQRGRLIGLIGAAFLNLKGSNFEMDDFARRAGKVYVNSPQAVLTTIVGATTTKFADTDISLTNEKDRWRLILGIGQVYGDTGEGTGLGDGVLDQIHKIGYYNLVRTAGRTDKQSGRRFSMGTEPAEQDGLTTLVAMAAACDPLDRILGPDEIEKLIEKSIDAQNPGEVTKLEFKGLNDVTAADSADGIQVATHQLVIDVIAGD